MGINQITRRQISGTMVLLNYTSKKFFLNPFCFKKKIYSSIQCACVTLYIYGYFLMKVSLNNFDFIDGIFFFIYDGVC